MGFLLSITAVLMLAAGFFHPSEQKAFKFEKNSKEIKRIASLPHLDDLCIFNTGTAEDLCVLPGIGETISSFVIEERKENGPFYYPEDILSVKGIGIKKLEQLRSCLTLSTESEE